jgi:hypothetical protein
MVEMDDEELFVVFGSVVVAETVAVLVDCVEELKVLAVTLIVTMAKPPTLIEPRLQPTDVVATV